MKVNVLLPYLKSILIAVFLITFFSCNKSDTSYTITVGAFTKDDLGNYNPTGNQLIFNSTEVCQTWSRTANSDVHSADSHLHYNAATDVDFNDNSNTFTWTEYGP